MPPLRRIAYPLALIPLPLAGEAARRLVPGVDQLVERQACADR